MAETHYTLAKEALSAGKDVFVEKPLCLEEDQAAELIWSFVPHDVSAILALAGEMPETVVSRGDYLHEQY